MACSGAAPLTVNFTSTPGGGVPPYTYLWTFGVAGETSTEQNPTYTFTEAGNYLCVLVITDLCGNTKQVNVLVEVTGAPPGPTCETAAAAGDVPVSVSGTITTDPSGDAYLWYSFTPAATGTYYLKGCWDAGGTEVGAGYLQFDVYEGPCDSTTGIESVIISPVGPDAPVGCSCSAGFTLTAGTTYYILVWKQGGTPAATINYSAVVSTSCP